jgi:flagellin
MRILQNIPALYAYRELLNTNQNIQRNIERLSSGMRITKAADDAAGFAISDTMNARVKGFEQAGRNTQDAVSYLHTAEGGMQVIDEKLQRMRTLAVQAATETLTSSDRNKIQLEIEQILAEIDRIASATEFNTHQPLTGEIIDIHVGAGEDETLTITVTSVTVTALGIGGLTVTGSCNTNAENAITSLDAALSIKLKEEGLLGAQENRLNNVIEMVSIMKENIAAAMSRIRDLDYAKEMSDFVKNQILAQAGTAMLAQANTMPQTVLQLLG